MHISAPWLHALAEYVVPFLDAAALVAARRVCQRWQRALARAFVLRRSRVVLRQVCARARTEDIVLLHCTFSRLAPRCLGADLDVALVTAGAPPCPAARATLTVADAAVIGAPRCNMRLGDDLRWLRTVYEFAEHGGGVRVHQFMWRAWFSDVDQTPTWGCDDLATSVLLTPTTARGARVLGVHCVTHSAPPPRPPPRRWHRPPTRGAPTRCASVGQCPCVNE